MENQDGQPGEGGQPGVQGRVDEHCLHRHCQEGHARQAQGGMQTFLGHIKVQVALNIAVVHKIHPSLDFWNERVFYKSTYWQVC